MLAAAGSSSAAAATAAGPTPLPTAAALAAGLQDDDDDFCPTCLEPYRPDNPKVWTHCGHHFHLPCIYEWMERKETCPICESPMQF